MQLEVKIDQEAIQQQLVQAIMNSAIGEKIQKALNEALSKAEGPWGDQKTLVERAVRGALEDELRKQAADLVAQKREQIRAALAEKLTDEVLGDMTNALWGVMLGRLKTA